MKVIAGCEILLNAAQPTPVILMLRPRSGLGQWILQEEYKLEPMTPIVEYTDGYGNLCQRLVVPAGDFQVYTTACVETADAIDVEPEAPFIPVEDLPEDVLQFLLPSRYCQSDQLGDLANQIVDLDKPAYEQVRTICDWIYTQLEYQYGTSDASTSAIDTATSKVGVCRDFAHLGIALCRSLTIPARMVVGYLYQLDPMDLHAWFEVFVGDRWYTFDATQANPRGNRITIAYGRDATDVALMSNFGPLELVNMRVWVDAAE